MQMILDIVFAWTALTLVRYQCVARLGHLKVADEHVLESGAINCT
jgi:hypothetical protein